MTEGTDGGVDRCDMPALVERVRSSMEETGARLEQIIFGDGGADDVAAAIAAAAPGRVVGSRFYIV